MYSKLSSKSLAQNLKLNHTETYVIVGNGQSIKNWCHQVLDKTQSHWKVHSLLESVKYDH